MTYLTFINNHTSYPDEVIENDKQTYKIGKWYDVVHVSSNPLPFIRSLYPYPTSSITLNYLGSTRELLPYVYLVIGKPGVEIPNAEPLEGVYSHMITSETDILDEIKKMDGVKGYLDLYLEEQKKIVVSREEKDIFNTQNNALIKEPKKKDIKEYMEKAAEFAEKLEYYDPTLIVAPLVHGSLLTTSILWYTTKDTAYRVLFPVGGNYIEDCYYGIDNDITALKHRTIIKEANTIPNLSDDTTEEVRRLCYINALDPTSKEYLEVKDSLYGGYAPFIECGGPNSFLAIGMSNKDINSLDDYKKREVKIDVGYGTMYYGNVKKLVSFLYNKPSFCNGELFEDDHEYSYYSNHVLPIKDTMNKLYSRIDLLADYMFNGNTGEYEVEEKLSLIEYLKKKISVLNIS